MKLYCIFHSSVHAGKLCQCYIYPYEKEGHLAQVQTLKTIHTVRFEVYIQSAHSVFKLTSF